MYNSTEFNSYNSITDLNRVSVRSTERNDLFQATAVAVPRTHAIGTGIPVDPPNNEDLSSVLSYTGNRAIIIGPEDVSSVTSEDLNSNLTIWVPPEDVTVIHARFTPSQSQASFSSSLNSEGFTTPIYGGDSSDSDFVIPYNLIIYIIAYSLALLLGALYVGFKIHYWEPICSAPFTPQSEVMTKAERRELYWRKKKSKLRLANVERPRFTPQATIPNSFLPSISTFTATVASMSSIEGVLFSRASLSIVEGFAALVIALREAASPSQFAAICTLYFKNHYSDSILALISDYVEKLFPEYTQQAAFDGPDPSWLLLMKDFKDNWSRVIVNEGFVRISKMLSLCISMGLCEMSSVTFSLWGVDLFSKIVVPKHASATDFATAIFSTVSYFVEGGYMCFRTGSLRPLLFGDHSQNDFEADYAKCLTCAEYAKCGNLQKFADISENDYDHLLDKTIEKADVLMLTCKGVVERNIMLKKSSSLRLWQTTFRQTRIQGGLRAAPYAIGIFGGTSVGKSSVANIMMVTTLLHNGFSADDDRIITLNEQDKFDSNYRTFVNGVFFDDVGNTKSEFVERAPTVKIIEYINNVRMYATVAEADKKGKVFIEPKVFITTKNVKDSGATTYSNEPASIARREKVTATVTVKPEYAVHDMLNQDKIAEAFPGGPPAIPDFWDIKLQTAYPAPNKVKGLPASVGWASVWFEGKWCDKIDIYTFIRYCGQDSEKWFKSQDELVDNSNNMAAKTVLCPDCRFPKIVCACNRSPAEKLACAIPKPLKPRNEVEMVGVGIARMPRKTSGYKPESFFSSDTSNFTHEDPSIERLVRMGVPAKDFFPRFNDPTWLERVNDRFYSAYNRVEECIAYYYYTVDDDFDRVYQNLTHRTQEVKRRSVEETMLLLDWFETSHSCKWTTWVPSWAFNLWSVQSSILYCKRHELLSRIRYSLLQDGVFFLMLFALALTYYWAIGLLLLFPITRAAAVVEDQKKILYRDIEDERETMPLVFKRVRDGHVAYITKACGFLGVIYGTVLMYRKWNGMSTQGNLTPTTMEDIDERDTEVNPWSGVVVTPMPSGAKSKTVTVDVLGALVRKNLCHMELRDADDEVCRCDAFFPKSNVVIIPQHVWHGDTVTATFVRHDVETIGGNFRAILSRATTVDIPNTDFCISYVPNGGDWKDLTSYFALGSIPKSPARIVYKDQVGNIRTCATMLANSTNNTGTVAFKGFRYKLKFDTFDGLCMAPLITETKGPVIAGFHLGGKAGTPWGCAGSLVYKQLDTALTDLAKLETVLLGCSEGTLPTTLYDVQYFQGTEIHRNSPINYLEPGANCRYHGQVLGRASYVSTIEPSCISDLVEKHTGQVQNWSGPPFHKGYPWQKSLNKSTHPAVGLPADVLSRAAKDFRDPILAHLTSIPKLMESVKPLSRMDNVCGKDGIRFIDKLMPNTSVGFPLSGPKSDHLGYLDGEDDDSHACPATLAGQFWDHADEMVAAYLAGQRAYPLFKACFKDESTKLTATKVRVIQGAPLAFQLLVRKYYLPVARVLSVNPILSECAVGINAHGPEWHSLFEHVCKYGKKRVLAGDYGAYDLTMPAQLMFAAFRIMMDIAKHCGYTAADLTIMGGVATDICYPMIAYNGDLIQHIGSNPSGHNLTVYVNCIVNSLFFRSAYFTICCKRSSVPFRQVCSLITYGDDAKSTVNKDYPEFNHISVAKFLADAGMVFTMPDKTSTPTPYMDDADADFLKRKSVYNPDVKMNFGALDSMSIMKSLHSIRHSGALTPEQQAAQNIDGALREWFFHGKEEYEIRRQQMISIAVEAEIDHQCSMLEMDYAQQLLVWRVKYDPEYEAPAEP